MPKVSKEYVEKKKEAIIEAALRVCRKKPLYEVTMTDIIREAGLSQGGIYLYFSDIDEVLVAVINRVNNNKNYQEQVDEITTGSANAAERIMGLLTFLGKYIRDNVETDGKFQFELTVLLANHPERQKKILAQLKEEEQGRYLIQQLFAVVEKGVAVGEFTPKLPLKDIFMFIIVSLDGIVRDTVLQRCYGPAGNIKFEIDEVGLMETLARSVLMLLN